MSELFLSEEISFSAAHRYFNPKWSSTENQKTFGPCANPQGHGHDYRLIVEIKIDESQVIEAEIPRLHQSLTRLREEVDHRHLNDFAEFQPGGRIPTTENLALFLWQKLKTIDPQLQISELSLFERPDLGVTISSISQSE